MSVDFKIYCQVPGVGEEIRRFSMPGLDYFLLRKKIYDIFHKCRFDSPLYWKDNEGDKIIISSDDDLRIALAETSSFPIKLYVTPQQNPDLPKDYLNNDEPVHTTMINDELQQKASHCTNPSTSDQDEDHLKNNGPVHITVNCDECGQKPLQGYRYKCLVCHNYDLCTSCEKSEKIHSEHPMIRIPVALNCENEFGRKYQHVKENIYGTLKCLLENR
ncbi:protein ref(2)P [Halyomorpha halys]|uniref:protein ref(2)P n=1 Tax=Halyomorpha halys TaxID=286706 RepID=UPI0006D4E183|nr:protein ref(2)P-like [Halyomorpha halys]